KIMQITNMLGLAAALSLLVGCNRSSDSSAAGGTDESPSQSSDRGGNASNGVVVVTPSEPDNTGKNVRDRSDATVTPDDQGNSDADRETSRRIRRAITASDQLSTVAKNIKIMTIDGKVTLRGPVKSEEEKSLIDSLVQQAGVTSVDDQLEVTNQ